MSDDRRGRRWIIIADIVDRTGPRALHRSDQHACQIRDMDARENLARLVDPSCGAGAQCIEGAAPGAVRSHMSRKMWTGTPRSLPKIEPPFLGGDAAQAGASRSAPTRAVSSTQPPPRSP